MWVYMAASNLIQYHLDNSSLLSCLSVTSLPLQQVATSSAIHLAKCSNPVCMCRNIRIVNSFPLPSGKNFIKWSRVCVQFVFVCLFVLAYSLNRFYSFPKLENSVPLPLPLEWACFKHSSYNEALLSHFALHHNIPQSPKDFFKRIFTHWGSLTFWL